MCKKKCFILSHLVSGRSWTHLVSLSNIIRFRSINTNSNIQMYKSATYHLNSTFDIDVFVKRKPVV